MNTTEFWIFKFAKIYTKFQFEPTILIFWTKFAQKGYFQSTSEKMNTTNKFCLFKSVYIPNFTLNCQFWFFGPNLAKEYLVKIGKKWTTYESHIFQISRYQTSASRIKFAPKGYFQSKTEKVNSTIKFCIFKLV